jgi:hypothetical protein
MSERLKYEKNVKKNFSQSKRSTKKSFLDHLQLKKPVINLKIMHFLISQLTLYFHFTQIIWTTPASIWYLKA